MAKHHSKKRFAANEESHSRNLRVSVASAVEAADDANAELNTVDAEGSPTLRRQACVKAADALTDAYEELGSARAHVASGGTVGPKRGISSLGEDVRGLTLARNLTNKAHQKFQKLCIK